MAKREKQEPVESDAAIEHELANEIDVTWPGETPPEFHDVQWRADHDALHHGIRAAQGIRDPEVDHIGVVAVAAEALRGEITFRGAPDTSNDLTHVLATATGAMGQLYDRVRELHETLVGRYESEGWSKPGIEDVRALPIFDRIRYESRETARIALAIRAVLDSIEAGLKSG